MNVAMAKEARSDPSPAFPLFLISVVGLLGFMPWWLRNEDYIVFQVAEFAGLAIVLIPLGILIALHLLYQPSPSSTPSRPVRQITNSVPSEPVSFGWGLFGLFILFLILVPWNRD